MAEPSQERVDLSGIHPLKRVTLIGLGFLFATSIVFALATQFVWVHVDLLYPGRWIRLIGLGNGIVLRHAPFGNIWGFHWDDGHYTKNSLGDHAFEVTRFFINGKSAVTISDESIVSIHHLYLISITAALYLFARWQIRRSARIQNPPF